MQNKGISFDKQNPQKRYKMTSIITYLWEEKKNLQMWNVITIKKMAVRWGVTLRLFPEGQQRQRAPLGRLGRLDAGLARPVGGQRRRDARSSSPACAPAGLLLAPDDAASPPLPLGVGEGGGGCAAWPGLTLHFSHTPTFPAWPCGARRTFDRRKLFTETDYKLFLLLSSWKEDWRRLAPVANRTHLCCRYCRVAAKNPTKKNTNMCATFSEHFLMDGKKKKTSVCVCVDVMHNFLGVFLPYSLTM